MAYLLALLLVIAVVLGLFALLRYQRVPPRARRSARKAAALKPAAGSLAGLQKNSFFWGAELWQPGCAESYRMLGQKFTFDDVPELPFAGCSRKSCTCQFKGLRDRRSRARRTHPDRRGEFRYDKAHPDRRSLVSRRRSDLWAHHTL